MAPGAELLQQVRSCNRQAAAGTPPAPTNVRVALICWIAQLQLDAS